MFARVSPALPLFVPNSKSTALVVLFPKLTLEVAVIIPVTTAPVFVVSNFFALSWYNSAAPDAWNVADNLDSSALDNLKLLDLSFKLPVPPS